ncbi:hypothetical protein [Shewanella frigidimarina]|uniref:Uncharacterized protein n=1 Tax=Shewanella frigidimarina (strain NCIMB 400) TaxID=318167 RepID=Q083M8_SHEFN|nr:hypothetical protein [Shewanella frigidimarina]ABI71537.1 conserved hypothetical protein [Shewanella frigidimarina NCIMB 400]
MSITRNDLKIFKPEQLGTSDDAGGQRTRNAVQSGKLNELFTAISDIDHAQSSLDIVKCYPALDTIDTGTLLDAHVFISQPPSDPLVSMLLVEADALDDEDRMVEMKEILESSVTAGSLIRSGAPGFLPNQNSFSREYLQSTYMFDGKEYRKTTSLRVGQVIAITVEYAGIEDADWPRKTHYCMVTDTNAPGNSEGNIVFDPPIDFATPDYNVTVNATSNCTKLRLTNEASPLTFHGVSKLTAASSNKNLAVQAVQQNLLPVVLSEQVKTGQAISDGDIVRKTVSQNATTAQSYQFALVDVLQGANIAVDYTPITSYTSGGIQYGSDDAIVVVSSDTVSVTLSRKPDLNTPVSLQYISGVSYQNYDNADVFPADRELVPNTLTGKVTRQSTPYQFTERDGALYITVFSSVGSLVVQEEIRAAIVDYQTGIITLENGISNLVYVGLVIAPESANVATFVLNASDALLDTFYMQVFTVGDVLISASCDSNGTVTGTGISGSIVNNLVQLSFTQDVKLSTLRYDITEQVRNLPPADIYGLNPLRIPNAGIVDIYRAWGTIAVSHTDYQNIVSPSSGTIVTIRTGSNFVDISDATGASLWTATSDHFSVDSTAGTVTLNSDFSGFTAPFILSDTISELALVTAVNTNKVTVSAALSREYPIGSSVASVQILGDLQARVGKVRDMTSWANNWDLDGEAAQGTLNTVDYPIEVTNAAAVNEDWVLVFTSTTAFRCVGKRIGQIATGDTVNDFAPINSLTNQPYFVIRSGAFGAGWNPGEAIRFATVASAKPVMPIRTVQAGHSQINTDRAVLAFRGNEA